MDDLGPNKARLYEVGTQAQPGDVLVDLGVRFGVSSRVMLDATAGIKGGRECQVFGVDIGASPFGTEPRYTFLRCDSVSAAKLIPDDLYLVFVDTIHVKEQVMAECHSYWPKLRVGGWLVFHDTEWTPGMCDHLLGKDWGQPIEGVNAFFGSAKLSEDIRMVRYTQSWGMMFVNKLRDWNPTVEGMEQALADSKRLTESLLK